MIGWETRLLTVYGERINVTEFAFAHFYVQN